MGRNLNRVDLTELIETRPGVRSGKPCFVGTRITVYDVLEYLASGMTESQIVADFPELTVQHVRAANQGHARSDPLAPRRRCRASSSDTSRSVRRTSYPSTHQEPSLGSV